jgi:predicted amidohydrolase
MKIGFLQCQPVLGDRLKTISHLNTLIDLHQKKLEGIDLLVLPELCSSGYNFETYEQAKSLAENIYSSPFLDFLSTVAKKFTCAIVSGFCEIENNFLYNSAAFVTPAGVNGVYRKIHLFNTEKNFFQPGNRGLPLFKLGEVNIGILICFDWFFPEVWRALMLKGADIICHPSNLVIPEWCQRTIPIHCRLNKVFTVTANRVGSENSLSFTGNSIIVDPKGEILTAASSDLCELSVVEINPFESRNKQITPQNELLADRRPEEYTLLSINSKQ